MLNQGWPSNCVVLEGEKNYIWVDKHKFVEIRELFIRVGRNHFQQLAWESKTSDAFISRPSVNRGTETGPFIWQGERQPVLICGSWRKWSVFILVRSNLQRLLGTQGWRAPQLLNVLSHLCCDVRRSTLKVFRTILLSPHFSLTVVLFLLQSFFHLPWTIWASFICQFLP